MQERQAEVVLDAQLDLVHRFVDGHVHSSWYSREYALFASAPVVAEQDDERVVRNRLRPS